VAHLNYLPPLFISCSSFTFFFSEISFTFPLSFPSFNAFFLFIYFDYFLDFPIPEVDGDVFVPVPPSAAGAC
jgi:hypothetical protein